MNRRIADNEYFSLTVPEGMVLREEGYHSYMDGTYGLSAEVETEEESEGREDISVYVELNEDGLTLEGLAECHSEPLPWVSSIQHHGVRDYYVEGRTDDDSFFIAWRLECGYMVQFIINAATQERRWELLDLVEPLLTFKEVAHPGMGEE